MGASSEQSRWMVNMLPNKFVIWAKVSGPAREHSHQAAVLLTHILTLHKKEQQRSHVLLVSNQLHKRLINKESQKILSPLNGDGHHPNIPTSGHQIGSERLELLFLSRNKLFGTNMLGHPQAMEISPLQNVLGVGEAN